MKPKRPHRPAVWLTAPQNDILQRVANRWERPLGWTIARLAERAARLELDEPISSEEAADRRTGGED